ncbi:sirohydrochlorin cobaltochelatase [Clostridium bovifaecis]|uniref:Sirohydrochlorin cobaltochelatase n=1 Tax=Clostridium bovifaecis TaxID=2184719 RepID=A0A6I6F9D9_9CLOT|nr:sirohydrochlorin cobaltochelatase [Clostridium bovifaecis]
MRKKGILVVSSGSINNEAIKVSIEAIENIIAEEFKEWEVRRAFTSEIIIKKLKQNDGIVIDKIEEALEKMKAEEFSEVILQPLHIIPGSEYKKIVELIKKYKNSFEVIKSGRTILFYKEDYKKALDALRFQIPSLKSNEGIVLVGHGTKHTANIYYKEFQETINKENLRLYVGTLDECPTIYDIIPKLREDNIEEVLLMPYMLVFGGHGRRDIAGDGEGSWKSILRREGFKVRIYGHGLGENIEYQKLYLQHVKDVIK